MKRYLLFDLDGTLTDPKEGITTCVQYALKAFGIWEPDLDKLEPFIGPPLTDSFMEFYHMDRAQAQAAVEKYRERFRDIGIFENKVYKGIPGMLKDLKRKGFILAVASSKPTVFVNRILEHFGIADYFQVVVGSELDGARVEKTEVIREALRQLFPGKPVDKDQVRMIGDRRFDVEGAHSQGVESVAVSYGYGSLEELKEARADYIVRSVKELHRFLLRETQETQLTPFRQFWQFAFPFVLFMLVRDAAAYGFELLLFWAGTHIPGAEFLFLTDSQGAFAGFTGNAVAITEAVGYAAGIGAVFGQIRQIIDATARDMRLSHLKREPVKNYLILFGLSVYAVFGLNILLEITGLTGRSSAYQAVRTGFFSANMALGLFCYGLLTPVAEELMFRGVIYGSLRRMMNRKAAVIFSALLFGVYHWNLVQGIYGAVMGCLMAYAYEYFGTIRAALLVHITANLLAYGMGSALSGAEGFWTAPVCALFLAAAAGGIFLLRRQKKVL